jgi:hypothetical protein
MVKAPKKSCPENIKKRWNNFYLRIVLNSRDEVRGKRTGLRGR